jgi:hypothetical protein
LTNFHTAQPTILLGGGNVLRANSWLTIRIIATVVASLGTWAISSNARIIGRTQRATIVFDTEVGSIDADEGNGSNEYDVFHHFGKLMRVFF